MSKILYAASTASHLRSFHLDYIERLRAEGHTVLTMARGEGVDFDIPFEKKILSSANSKCKSMIKEVLLREKFDIIILNTSLAAFHIRACLPKSEKERPRVVNIVHGYLFPKHPEGIKARLRAWLLLLAEKTVRSVTDEIIVMNREDLEIAKKHRLSKSEPRFIFGMGVKIKDAVKEKDEIRRELGLTDRRVIAFVGELSGRKNQAMLIRALAHLPECYSLLLVGEGDERENLEALRDSLGLTERVLLIGRRENAMDYMRASDVYASAARSEGLPFNLVEAIALGIPTVASRVKGHTDIIKNEERLFDLSDTEALQRAILLADSDKSHDTSPAHPYLFASAFEDTYKEIKLAAGIGD